MIDIDIIRRKRDGGTTGTTATTAGVTVAGGSASSSNAAYATKAGEADHAANATHADSAKELDGNSTVWQKLRDTVAALSDDYLSKTDDDTAQGLITFAKGLISEMLAKLKGGATFGTSGYKFDEKGNVVVDALSSLSFDEALERGFGFTKNALGKYTLSVTDLVVWGKAVFNSLEIRKLYSVGGNVYLSGASSKLQHVVPISDSDGTVTGWKCYILGDDGTTATQNGWARYDQAKCQTFDIKAGVYEDVSNTYYWRLVTDVSTENEAITETRTETYVDDDGQTKTREVTVDLYDGKKFAWVVLSRTDCESTTNDEPKAGDTIVLDGHRMFTSGDDEGRDQYNDESRTNVMMLETTGAQDGSLPRIVALTGITDYKHSDGTNEYSNTVFILSPKEVVFVSSSIKWLSASGDPITFVNFRGKWVKGMECAYYDQVSHDNAIWTCVVERGETTTVEPTDDNPTVWRMEISSGKGEKGDPGKDAVAYELVSYPGYIKLNADGSIDYSNGYTDPEKGTIDNVHEEYLVVRGYKVVNGVKYNKFATDEKLITCCLSFNGGDAYFDNTAWPYEDVNVDFDPVLDKASLGSLPDEISKNNLKNAKAIMYEGENLDPGKIPANKILATLDIPIVQDGKQGADGTNGKDAVTYGVQVSPYYQALGGSSYAPGLQLGFTKTTGAKVETFTDVRSMGCTVEIRGDETYYSAASGYVNDGHSTFLYSSYPLDGKTLEEASVISVRLYLDGTVVATASLSNGKQGADGMGALEIICDPETIVIDTDDKGLATGLDSASASLMCLRDGKGVSVTWTMGTRVNCEATVSASGVVDVTKVTTQTVGDVTVSCTSGSVTVNAYDPTTKTTYAKTVPFTVNMARYTGGLKADNKKLQSQYTELTNDGSITDLTEYKSEILQTAREISLKVSEKQVGRRNLLPGSALRKQGDGVYINLYGNTSEGEGIVVNGGMDGVNGVKVTAKGDNFAGVYWRALGGARNVKIKRNTKYTLSVWAKAESESGVVINCEAVYQKDGTTFNRDGRLTPNTKYPTIQAGTWQLFTATVQTDDSHDWMEANFWACTRDSSNAVSVWLCRPMLEEGDEYNGWTLSEQDYDYVGGNLLDGTGTLTKTGNVTALNGEVTQGGMGESASLYKMMHKLAGRVSTKTSLPSSATVGDYYACNDTWRIWKYTGTTASDDEHYNGYTLVNTGDEMLHNDFLVFKIDLEDNKDYVVSWYAKGNGDVGCYFAGNGQKVWIEAGDGYTLGDTATYGENPMYMTSEWKRYWVHVRKTEGTAASLCFRQYRNSDNTASEVYLSRPKLEVGATMTEWTERRSDMVDKQALLATGIDIESRKITLTADKTYVRSNDGDPIAVFSADGGYINSDILNVQHVYAKDDDGTVYGHFGYKDATGGTSSSGKQYPLWVGAANCDTAPFAVSSTGDMYANSGMLGPFSIGGYGISSPSFDTGTGMKLGFLITLKGATFNNVNNQYEMAAVIGGHTEYGDPISYLAGGGAYSDPTYRDFNTTFGYGTGRSRQALYVRKKLSSGNDPSTSIDIHGSNGKGGKDFAAMIVDSDCMGVNSPSSNFFGGMACGLLRVSSLSGTNLTAWNENRVTVLVAVNSSEVTIPLPTYPEVGQMIWIIQQGGRVNFTTDVKHPMRTSNTSNYVTSGAASDRTGQINIFIWDGSYWNSTCISGGLFK